MRISAILHLDDVLPSSGVVEAGGLFRVECTGMLVAVRIGDTLISYISVYRIVNSLRIVW